MVDGSPSHKTNFEIDANCASLFIRPIDFPTKQRGTTTIEKQTDAEATQ